MKKTKFPEEVVVASLEVKQVFEFPKDGQTKPGGAEGKLLQLLSQHLHFRYKLVTPPDKQWGGQHKNGSWSGLIGIVNRGEADLAMCFSGISEKRKVATDFTEPYSENDLTFATRFPRMQPRAYAYMYPFDVFTWTGILIMLFLMPLVFRLLKAKKFSYSYFLLKLYGTLFNQPVVDTQFSSLILLGCWWYFSIIISAGYAAVLSSLLTVPIYETLPTTFEELASSVKRGDFKVLGPLRAAVVPGLYETGQDKFVYIASTIDKHEWYVPLNKYMAEETYQHKTAILAVRLMLNFNFGRAPLATKFISDDTSFILPVGIVVNKKFCCKHMLDSAIKKVNQAGLYLRLINEHLYKAWFNAFKEDSDTHRPLALEDILAGLVILLSGYCISLSAFFIEIFYFHLFKRSINKY
ncbi:glutamate receptor ionotropic, delta-1 [Caerostris darwini]|uniref:Glutamate receptor ionotropic, delta-1 n=1 Tax=Caerostris darwini TaxID=1538125 RepID=A0AAV4S847_9ARAC|nr:glutamate receptor ionotropic, delta-1 [Caerostris darwini]